MPGSDMRAWEGVCWRHVELVGVSSNLSPNGFDPDRKRDAGEVDYQLRIASGALGVAAVGVGLVLPPLAVGLTLAAGMAQVLRLPFERIKNDPPREDFTLPVGVRPMTIDPTLLAVEGLDDNDLISKLPSLVVGFDRAGAYLDAVVTASERAMGAHFARSGAAVDLRLAEARSYARRAQVSLATTRHVARALIHSRSSMQTHVINGLERFLEDKSLSSEGFWRLPDVLTPAERVAVRYAGLEGSMEYPTPSPAAWPGSAGIAFAVELASRFAGALARDLPSTDAFLSEAEGARERFE